MFGRKIDYFLLKPFTHKKNYKTEEELMKERSSESFHFSDGNASEFMLEDATKYLDKIQLLLGKEIPINKSMNYLDIGCGNGRLSIGLSIRGAKNIIGIEISDRKVIEANLFASKLNTDSIPKFYLSDIHDWKHKNEKYDALFVIGAMEHIHSPLDFMKKMAALLKPEGTAYVSFEPFQSPIGDHMHGFFNFIIPYRGILFSEHAILKLRREFFRPSDKAMRFQDIVGGLNKMSYSEYLYNVNEAGLEFVHNSINPQLRLKKKYFLFRIITAVLTKIPIIRNYFITNVYSAIRLKK